MVVKGPVWVCMITGDVRARAGLDYGGWIGSAGLDGTIYSQLLALHSNVVVANY